jgi:hypothetical protein
MTASRNSLPFRVRKMAWKVLLCRPRELHLRIRSSYLSVACSTRWTCLPDAFSVHFTATRVATQAFFALSDIRQESALRASEPALGTPEHLRDCSGLSRFGRSALVA